MENMVSLFDSLKETYSGKKVFLTGHTGFKGSWLLKMLVMLGSEVKGYALSPENEEDLFNVIHGDQLCNSVIADIRDRDRLVEEVRMFQPDFVFHLAAQPLVRLSYAIPAETFEVNALGTAYLLDAVKELEKACQIVLITTDKVYHNNEWVYPYRENERLGGFDPYSASKACAELVIDSYRNSFFNMSDHDGHRKSLAVARAGNVIGGGDWAKDRLIPDIIRSLIAGKNVQIRNPKSVRPWQHVLEPVTAYLILGQKLASDPRSFSTAFNFGPQSSDALPVIDMVKLALDAWGQGSFEVVAQNSAPHEAGLLKLDISKAEQLLNWKPKMNSLMAVKYTIDWYKAFSREKDTIAITTEQQIQQYLNA